jgi:hypothetical protein
MVDELPVPDRHSVSRARSATDQDRQENRRREMYPLALMAGGQKRSIRESRVELGLTISVINRMECLPQKLRAKTYSAASIASAVSNKHSSDCYRRRLVLTVIVATVQRTSLEHTRTRFLVLY